MKFSSHQLGIAWSHDPPSLLAWADQVSSSRPPSLPLTTLAGASARRAYAEAQSTDWSRLSMRRRTPTSRRQERRRHGARYRPKIGQSFMSIAELLRISLVACPPI
jgi:hypothetical protein